MTVPADAAPGPFQLTGTATCYGYSQAILLQWTSSLSATSYTLHRDDGVYGTFGLQVYDPNVVMGGPAHSYFIRASDAGGVTTDSNTVTVAPGTTPCSPPPVQFTISGTAICDPGSPQAGMNPAAWVEWRSVLYASSYDVYRNGTLLYSTIGGASLYELDDIKQAGGVTITYYVIAKNDAGTSTSNSIDVTLPVDICVTAPPVPVLSGTAVCNSQTHVPIVNLNWTIVTGVRGWQVYRDGSPYAVPGGAGYTDTNVEPGHTYTYNVSTNGLSAPLSNTITVGVPATICAPGPFSVTESVYCNSSKSAVRLNWTASANALSYTVLRDGTILASGVTSSGYNDTSVVVGSTYSYQVIAINNSGSMPSPPAMITVGDEVCPPEGFTASAVSTCVNAMPSILLTWSGSAHAASYVVSRDNTTVSGTLSGTARQYIDDGAPVGPHVYTVRATNAVGFQGATAAVTLLASACGLAPGGFSASASALCSGDSPAVHIQWSAASSAASYVVNSNGVPLSGVLSSSATSYDDTTATVGQSYTYMVVASNAGGTSTATAGTITPSAGDCPPGAFTLTATTACGLPVTLTWTEAPNSVLNYSIFRNQVLLTALGSNTLTYADDSTLPSAAYAYFVRAVGLGGARDSNSVTLNVDRSLCDPTAPDLVALDISPSTLSGRAGDTISVTFALMNGGNALAPATMARIRFGRGPSMAASDTVLATIPLPALASLESLHHTMDVTLPAVPAGTYRLFLSLDEEHVSGDVQLADNVKESAALTLADAIPPKRRAARH